MAKIRAAIAAIDTSLPNIPPEERAYLDRENNSMVSLAATDPSGAGQRMKNLEARPLYGVWQVRVPLEESTRAVDKVYEKYGMGVAYYKAEDANILHRMMTLSTFVGDLNTAVEKYLDQESPAVSVGLGNLTRPEFASILRASGDLHAELEFAMQCQLATVLAGMGAGSPSDQSRR